MGVEDIGSVRQQKIASGTSDVVIWAAVSGRHEWHGPSGICAQVLGRHRGGFALP